MWLNKKVLVGLFLFAVNAAAEDRIYSLIARGELESARQVLSETATASSRDGNLLYFQSLLETQADKAKELMEVSLNASVSPEFHEEIYYRLAQYNVLFGNAEELGRIVQEYLSRWEGGKYRDAMLRYSVRVDEMRGSRDAALRQVDRYLLEHSSGVAEQWGLIDKSRVMMRDNKQIGAQQMLKKLSREKEGPGVSVAMYLLASDAAATGEIDNAVFYYNLLREEYPFALGLDAVADRMAGISTGYSDAAAEKRTGTFYSVQVGVYSEPDNAKKQADHFKVYGQPIDIKEKVISDRQYRVVYIGKFSTYLDAQTFKDMLETKHNDAFQVVAR